MVSVQISGHLQLATAWKLPLGAVFDIPKPWVPPGTAQLGLGPGFAPQPQENPAVPQLTPAEGLEGQGPQEDAFTVSPWPGAAALLEE